MRGQVTIQQYKGIHRVDRASYTLCFKENGYQIKFLHCLNAGAYLGKFPGVLETPISEILTWGFAAGTLDYFSLAAQINNGGGRVVKLQCNDSSKVGKKSMH